jgi:hypothetical protein
MNPTEVTLSANGSSATLTCDPITAGEIVVAMPAHGLTAWGSRSARCAGPKRWLLGAGRTKNFEDCDKYHRIEFMNE